MKLAFIVVIYFCWVLVSVFTLARMDEDLRQKYPSLIDKRWKRLLWLCSCLLFVPLLVIPLFAVDAIKEFINKK